jgi:CubicO group peptidase (beta-lactamase class C family)
MAADFQEEAMKQAAHWNLLLHRISLGAALALVLTGALAARPGATGAQAALSLQEAAARLKGLDAYMEKTRKDWNAPGIAVGVVVGDQLVFARGYGYRDYEKKLPFTPRTLFQIASNTKLFTAVGAGLLVEEGKLDWDRPVRESVPAMRFYNDELNNTVTLRDMLSHRTGITRHDMIWYQSPLSRKELFERVRFMEPKEPLRTTFLYNNMMYTSVGYLMELQSGATWEEFIRQRIFQPLEMSRTVFTVAEMTRDDDHAVPFTERRDGNEIYQIPYYEDTAGMAPCGAIVSSVEEMSHWLMALMNGGRFRGKQVLPPAVLKSTLEPAMALPNTMGEVRGYWELQNSVYGMGRWTASYRGHLLAYHGGDLDGFHSQVSYMPQDGVGVIVFVIGDHCASLYNTVSYDIYERLLGLKETPWNERLLAIRLQGKKADTEARAKAGSERVAGTQPSHPLAAYAGEYEHPAYGIIRVSLEGAQLKLNFHKIELPLSHFHYDRFDTPDDEHFGKWSLNFITGPEGNIDRVATSLDEAEASFTRRPEAVDAAVLPKLAGAYLTPTGFKVQVVLKEDGSLVLAVPGQPEEELIHYQGLLFRIKAFSDLVFEFVLEGDKVTGLKQRDPSGEHILRRE